MTATIDSVEDLDALLHQEKQNVARSLFEEAWDEAVAEGIEPALVAEAAVHSALAALGRAVSPDAVTALLDKLVEHEASGKFRADHRLH